MIIKHRHIFAVLAQITKGITEALVNIRNATDREQEIMHHLWMDEATQEREQIFLLNIPGLFSITVTVNLKPEVKNDKESTKD